MIRRIRLAAVYAILWLACTSVLPLKAEAIPAFSRQIHAGCYTCHFQGMGALNAFGRAFEMNNFSLTKKMRQELQERKKKKRGKRKQGSHKKSR